MEPFHNRLPEEKHLDLWTGAVLFLLEWNIFPLPNRSILIEIRGNEMRNESNGGVLCGVDEVDVIIT